MSEMTEAMDVFFNRRPAESVKEMERLRTENSTLKAIIRGLHSANERRCLMLGMRTTKGTTMTTKVLIVNYGPDFLSVRTMAMDSEPGEGPRYLGHFFVKPGEFKEHYVHSNQYFEVTEDKTGQYCPPDPGPGCKQCGVVKAEHNRNACGEHDYEDPRATARTSACESKGACPKCGCEETNSRGLWTCECPA